MTVSLMPEESPSNYITSSEFLKVEDLSLQFKGQTVLEGLSFSLFPKEIVMLIGPNGGGKSSLVRTLLRFISPTQGKIIYSQPTLRIGYMPQKHWENLEINLTADRFLHLHPSAKNIEIYQKAVEMSQFPEHLKDLSLSKLSGGERQRLLLARALLNQPQWLVLDEPTAHLDPQGQRQFYQRLSQIRTLYNCAILFVSHDLHRVLAKADRVLCLDKRFQCMGKPSEIPCQSCQKEVAFPLIPDMSCYRHSTHP